MHTLVITHHPQMRESDREVLEAVLGMLTGFGLNIERITLEEGRVRVEVSFLRL